MKLESGDMSLAGKLEMVASLLRYQIEVDDEGNEIVHPPILELTPEQIISILDGKEIEV